MECQTVELCKCYHIVQSISLIYSIAGPGDSKVFVVNTATPDLINLKQFMSYRTI